MTKLKFNKKRLLRLGWPFIVLFVLALFILRERIGLEIKEFTSSFQESYEDRLYEVSDEEFSDAVPLDIECLVISDSRSEQSNLMWEEMQVVLDDMRIGYDLVDLAETTLPDLSGYEKIVMTADDLSVLGDEVETLCLWVEDGGQFMSTGTFQINSYYRVLAPKMGITNIDSLEYTTAQYLSITDGFMINANDRVFKHEYPIQASLYVALTSDCEIYVKEAESGVPLIWGCDYGEGKFVVTNQVLTGKQSRGFLCASYSMLGDVCVYPVINGSVFYLDDFPSPVPTGDSVYIEEEYGLSVSSFYTNIWWPDMLALEEEYGIVHTGLIIEDYSDVVEGNLPRQVDTDRFTFFGNMLLNNGGELGFHGYNHMPLVGEDYVYTEAYDSYSNWPSVENMKKSITELQSFASELYEGERFGVYVPPSNIFSEEGREALKEAMPDFKVVASLYEVGGESLGYEQEFEVAEDGIVEAPRITSGMMITEYQTLSAFSELTFHYVQSHFTHPDDALDLDRGADQGWSVMYETFKEYVDYIYTAAPNIRNLSGSGMGEAIREFDKLSVSTERTDNVLYITLGGFYKEAYLMVRINDGQPGAVTGGTLENVTGDLYLLHATSDEIRIEIE